MGKWVGESISEKYNNISSFENPIGSAKRCWQSCGVGRAHYPLPPCTISRAFE